MYNYQLEQQQQQQQMKDTAAAIAQALVAITGEQWTPDQSHSTNATIKGQNGYGLHLRYYSQNAQPRLRISGDYPPAADGSCSSVSGWDNPPKITVSLDRPPAGIARDIERRLMDDYKTLYHEIEQREAQASRRLERIDAVAAEIADILKTKVRRDYNLERPLIFNGPHSTRFEIMSPNAVTIDLTTDPLTAKRIAHILADS